MPHWEAMRAEIAALGLDGLVAKSGEAAMDSLVRQVEGVDDKRDFDPLMNANWAICGQYIKDVGLVAMEGDKCPLCEVERSREGLAVNWIKGAIAEQRQVAERLGLVPGKQ